jgi:Pregnancy-associated plasma protein-A/Secretion system C-terminal sorting domain/Fibronectin type III domain
MDTKFFTFKHLFLSLAAIVISPNFINAQEEAHRNCGAMELLARQMQENPALEKTRQDIEMQTARFAASKQSSDRAVVTIPVVFHIVWRGAVPAENITDAQIISQMESLNKDFSLLNSDASKIPVAFKTTAANIGVQFKLASRTPWGAATNGINRYQSSRLTYWGANDEIKDPIKGGVQAWDSKQYLNIWVCAIGSNILGYAQFPGGGANTDGVVTDYQCVGLNGTARAPFNLGRTITHEVGHWMNLYHIWGNGACGDDMVSDTPKQGDASYGCPTFPQLNNCSGTNNAKMTMNYMDYTNDQCMYMFSNGQKTRIQALFAAGGARASLLTSRGLETVVSSSSTAVTCGTPKLNVVSDLYATSAMVSWVSPEGATSFNVQYKVATATNWTKVAVSTNSYNIPGLKENTDYQYQVQAICYGNPGSLTPTATFKTPFSSACGAPQTVTPSLIQYNSATIKWSAVPGATQYKFQFKRNTATTWNIYTLTGTACKLNISPSTTYQVQVAAVCGTSVSASSPITSFSTPAAPPPCVDAHEVLNNNTMTAASAIIPNVATTATISASTDVDWFSFSNSAASPHIQVTLSNLKVNYGVNLYSAEGTLLSTSNNIGIANEIMRYNNAPVGKYYVQVFNNAGSNDTYNCYNLIANTSATPYASGTKEGGDAYEDTDFTITEQMPASILQWEMGTKVLQPETNRFAATEAVMTELTFKVFPNPVSNNAIVSVNNAPEEEVKIDVYVFDAMGRIIYENAHTISAENNKVIINMNDQQNGLYLIRVKSNELQQVQKIMVRK